MAKIYTREEVNKIVSNADLTEDEKTERLFSLYGRALDDGYISKTAAATAQQTAIDAALANVAPPDIRGSEEYKALEGEYTAYKAMQAARSSDDYKGVKPKFFETVYGMVDKADGAKPVAEQLTEIAKKYEEYFVAGQDPEQNPVKPTFGAEPEGGMPQGSRKPSFGDAWGYGPKK